MAAEIEATFMREARIGEQRHVRERNLIANEEAAAGEMLLHAVERDPNLTLVVAESAGRVVGCLQLAILPGLSSQGGVRGLLEDVRVASDCRSRGIGEQLVQWAVVEAKARGCNLVELLTHQTRVDAQRFYKRLGFAASHVGMTVRF